ncbi:MAG: diguanylate cyclase domain-containing protein, partial [Sphingosinicella sp.]
MTDKSIPKLDWRVVFNRAAPAGSRGWGRVRAAQLHEMGRAMEIAAWGQTFNALLIAYMMIGRAPALHVSLWLLSLVMLMHHISRHRDKLRRRQIHSIPRKTLNRAAYHSVLFGFIWAFPARHFFEYATHGQQLGICVIIATMMAGAASIFAPVAPAAAPYVLIMGVAVTRMLMTTDSIVITVIGPIYTAAMLWMVVINGRSFMQRKCLDLVLEERQETVSLLLREYESSDADWLWQTNAKLSFQNASARFARALGRPSEELEGMTFPELMKSVPRGDQSVRRALTAAEAAMKRREPFSEVMLPLRVGGIDKNIEMSARPVFNKVGRFIGYRGVGSDVTAARHAADRIAHMARHDALTGLPNRFQLLENLDAALKTARDRGGECAVLLIDLDRFKTINDSLGHV